MLIFLEGLNMGKRRWWRILMKKGKTMNLLPQVPAKEIRRKIFYSWKETSEKEVIN